jgi:hypothetical protein
LKNVVNVPLKSNKQKNLVNATDPQHCSEEKYLYYYSLDMAATEGVHVYSQNGSMLFYFGELGVRGQGQGCLINVLYTLLRCRKVFCTFL